MNSLFEIETLRLRLRQWQDSDLKPFSQMNRDPEVMAYFPGILSRRESDAMALRCQTLIATNGWGLWAVESKVQQKFIGFVGLNSPGYELPFSPCIEIGWRLMRQAWGKGYATEAAQAVLAIGFKKLELEEIVSFCVIDNSRSYAVMDKLGMVKQIKTFMHPLIKPGSPLCEHYLYKITKAGWLQRDYK